MDMRERDARWLLAVLAVLGTACSNGVKVEFFGIDGEELSPSEQRTVENIARATWSELRHLPLPGLERDFAGVHPPWGNYPADADQWVEQLRALPDTVERKPWLFGHPDGRRWIAHKAGTYLVDRAVRASGKSPSELVTRPTEEILELAARP